MRLRPLAAVLLAAALTLVVPGRADAAKVEADVALTLGRPSPILVGQASFLTVNLINDGPDPATAVTATLQVPDGLTVRSGASCAPAGAGVVCTVGPTDIPAGFGAAAMVEVRGDVAGTYSVTGTVAANQPDPVPANNTATATIEVVAPTAADVRIALSGDPTAYTGTTFGFSVGVFNAGPATATGVTATVRLPAGMTVVVGPSCVPDGDGTLCTLGATDLPAGAGVSSPVLVTATAPGTYTVTGSATADRPDPVPADNAASTTVTVVTSADVSVDIAPAAPGKTLTYVVTVANAGPSPSPAVTLAYSWTASTGGGARLVSAGTTQGSCTAGTTSVSCDLGTLGSGAWATVTVRLRPRGVGTVTNQARVTSADDPNPANDTDTETTVVG